MKELLLIRHGETDHNKELRFTGFSDIPLNSKGREQAENLKDKFLSEGITSVYSSDLKRAAETAEILSGGGRFEITPALREMNFGIFETLNYEEIMKDYSEEFNLWGSDKMNYRIPQGESYTEMAERVLTFVGKVLESDFEKAAVVSHSGCIRTILAYYLLGSVEDTWKFVIDNCTISRLCIGKRSAFLKTLNEK
jgi:alpha-ribazole phosphatase